MARDRKIIPELDVFMNLFFILPQIFWQVVVFFGFSVGRGPEVMFVSCFPKTWSDSPRSSLLAPGALESPEWPEAMRMRERGVKGPRKGGFNNQQPTTNDQQLATNSNNNNNNKPGRIHSGSSGEFHTCCQPPFQSPWNGSDTYVHTPMPQLQHHCLVFARQF